MAADKRANLPRMAHGNSRPIGLAPFKGKPVLATSVVIKNAGDGLSKALAADPLEMTPGYRYFVVLEVEAGDVHFKRITEGDRWIGWNQCQLLHADTATFVDEDLVGDQLEKQRIRVEEFAGIHRLDLEGREDSE